MNQNPQMNIVLLSDKATIPTRNNPTDAGLDLYAAEDMVIPAGEGRMIKTDVAIELPDNVVGMICDRSGMGKKGFKVHGGIVDVPYRGSVNVILWNHTGVEAKISYKDKIAQLLVIPVLFPELKVVNSLSETERGDKGFGSSGN